ncbi:MAG: hypothetical protein QOF98_1609, partial [Streptomyces sp.]|nr:hypothetical protein [Streptomyces sp.]
MLCDGEGVADPVLVAVAVAVCEGVAVGLVVAGLAVVFCGGAGAVEPAVDAVETGTTVEGDGETDPEAPPVPGVLGRTPALSGSGALDVPSELGGAAPAPGLVGPWPPPL